MAESLQDQLLKLGVVDEKRLKQTKQAQHKQRKKQGRGGSGPSEGRQRAEQAHVAKVERDRALNRERMSKHEQKALRARIKQIIEGKRLPKGDGEAAYNFIDGRKVKRLYVSEPVRVQLVDGRCGVVKLHGQYDIVPREVLEQVRQLDPDCVVLEQPDGESGTPQVEADDPYAQYQVPDDLMW